MHSFTTVLSLLLIARISGAIIVPTLNWVPPPPGLKFPWNPVPHPIDPTPIDPGYNVTAVEYQSYTLASHSWEYGTAAEAMLELYNPELSVFGAFPFPVPKVAPANVRALVYAQNVIDLNTPDGTLIDGDGAVGDPASLGVSAVLIGQTNSVYMTAAASELNSLLTVAPRFWNGAISHRYSVPELWADFIYMAPPFMAYYAAATRNATLLAETVRQIGLHRQILHYNTTASDEGLWEHIIGSTDEDDGLWSTGNAWAAAGMTRVLATVLKAQISGQNFQSEVSSLVGWIKEILDGAMHSPKQNGLLYNYLNDTDYFGETSGTALLSSVAYRVAVLAPLTFGPAYVAWADAGRLAIANHTGSNGIMSPAVDPLDWYSDVGYTQGSPEGESFGVLLYTAYRDCVQAGVCGRPNHWRRRRHRVSENTF